jgi:hypothetical protein
VNAAFGPVPVFPDLLGFGPVAAEHAVDWPLLVDVPGRPAAQRAKRIDGRLPASLIALPTQITGELEGSGYASLANRDLERGQTVGLPSGEAVARALGVQPPDSDQVGLAAYGWRDETPLWFYVLKEAEALRDGNRLGPVGGRIVGEVLVGIVTPTPSRSARSSPPAGPRCRRGRQDGSAWPASWFLGTEPPSAEPATARTTYGTGRQGPDGEPGVAVTCHETTLRGPRSTRMIAGAVTRRGHGVVPLPVPIVALQRHRGQPRSETLTPSG